MKTLIAVLGVSALLTIPVLVVRTLALRLSLGFVATAILGFVVMQLMLANLLNETTYRRASSFERVLQGAVRQISQRPRLVLLGSSYFSRGINGALLEKLLNEQGYDLQVIQLSYPGAFAYAQDYFLDRYLALSSHPPNWVIIELGSEQGLTIHPENRYTSEVLVYHDWERSRWMLRQLVDNATGLGCWERLSLLGQISLHLIAHYIHIGILQRLESVVEVSPLAGFQPEEEAGPQAPSAASINAALDQAPAPQAVEPVTLALRQTQAVRLRARGVQQVLFTQPPFSDAKQRGRTSAVCAQLSPYCVAADAELMNALRGSWWTDFNHLTAAGADLYTRWLATQLGRILESNGAF